MEPIFLIWRNWSRKSSSVKPSPSRAFLANSSTLLAVERGLGLFDERHHVAHAEDAADDAVGMEGLEGVGLFADADELDGLAGDVANRERCAAAGIAVHLGEHDAGEAEALVKILRGVDGVLAGHGVGDEQESPDGLSSFLSRSISPISSSSMCRRPAVSTMSVSQPMMTGFAAGFFGQAFDERRAGGFAFLVAFVEFGFDGFGDDLELLARGGAIDVDRDEHGPMAALLEPGGELAAGGGFAGALQAGHENDRGRLRGEFEAGRVFAEQCDQLVADDLDDLLGGRKRGEHLGSDGLDANVLDQVA